MKFWKNRQPEPSADTRYNELAAEYSNYRRRTSAQLEQANTQAARQTVLQFLPLYDDLERALCHACQDEAFYRGVEMMMAKLLEILAASRVQPMDSLGKCFNPAYHEAVEHIENEKYRDEEIVEVIQTGFTMDEEVIRHAKVVVAN